MIERLLVANRGEIAVRIMATAAVLGVRTTAVHPDDDAACAHVTLADDAVVLPGSGAGAYLDVEAMVAAATGSGCDALHPGYGFLSERAELATRCHEAGIVFVGPSPEALLLFGDKRRARAHAASVGVPVLAAAAADDASALLREHGAVLVKAVAGGGGRGIREAHDEAQLAAALERCSSEARTAFGDGTVYVEQLLAPARHVEVQVVGDGTSVVVLGDRDCSIQRRRQKLIEIAPAVLPEPVRRALHDAARRIIEPVGYAGLATVEFLVQHDTIAFLEVNPRLQVEHTVTEQVTGLDLVELGLRVASGERLGPLDVTPRGAAVQVRVNTETLHEDGTVIPTSGTLSGFQPPAGHGVRVDTHGYDGWTVGTHYDSLLAKVITEGATLADAGRRAERALASFSVDGIATNIGVLRDVLDRVELGAVPTNWFDQHAAELAPPEAPDETDETDETDDDTLTAPMQATVLTVGVVAGDNVTAGDEVIVLEAMKMEHEVCAPASGTVRDVHVRSGDTVEPGAELITITTADGATADAAVADDVPLEHVRADLAEVLERHRIGTDEARPAAVERRHAGGHRTARENIADLVDEGSFVEYGALTIAAQRRRRSIAELIERTPADGLVLGTATVDGRPIAVLAYDYTVLAGTQGYLNHRKTDRLLELAARERLPVVLFAEGGGGRPGDTDMSAVAQLDVPTFRRTAELSGVVPLVAVVSGYCFAGNAALAAACDVIIATEDASLGMGGPAMIEGGGLGVVAPADVGPMSVQVPNGVVDVLVRDEAEAVAVTRRYLSFFGPPAGADDGVDQRVLRRLVPESRVRSYDARPVLAALFDADSVLELRPEFGVGVHTALARLDGRAVGVLANNPRHLGGAIDGAAADKATAFLRLCDAHGLPVVSLVDTPGFMVGPDAERTGTVRRFGAMFVAGAHLRVPICAVVLRKSYGLGAMAMCGGDLHRPALTVAWPSGEFGGMGLEGAVRLGFRKELDEISDPDARQARYDELVAEYYERGKALSTATVFEIDDVIDPADTRRLLVAVLSRSRP